MAIQRHLAFLASMRPRVIPADDLCACGRVRPAADHASMRPRVIPADDKVSAVDRLAILMASMRPRVIPADDVTAVFDASRPYMLQ